MVLLLDKFAEDALLLGSHILTELNVVAVILEDLDGLMMAKPERFVEEREVIERVLGLDGLDLLGRTRLEALEDADEEAVQQVHGFVCVP